MLALSIRGLERLGALMRDLLNYLEMGNAPQQRTPLPLEEPLNIALANLEHHIFEHNADISATAMPTLSADRTQMVVVFQNLIGNALKYRREAERPRIQIGAAPKSREWLFSVSDNGEGFEPEYGITIFEPFKRLHGPAVPGSGIGLATCKRIIERSGGRIWAESIPGAGRLFISRFRPWSENGVGRGGTQGSLSPIEGELAGAYTK